MSSPEVMQVHDEPHLPHGSVWPFWLAMAIFLIGLGLLWPGPVTIVALLFLVVVLIGWFREDFRWWASNTGTGLHIPRAGTLLFIGSEIFLFGGLFASYFTFKGQAAHWPDAEVHLPLGPTMIFTVLLLSSSWTLHQAEKNLKLGRKKQFNTWWGVTILLGTVFLGGQVNEYLTLIGEGHTLGSSHFMTTFYMLTGTHGLHVFGGLVALTIVWIRSLNGQFTASRHAAPECVSLYWHFVDIVWLVVMPTMYLLSGAALGGGH